MINKRPKPPEPEIIPPGQNTPRMRAFVDTRSTERVYIAKPGLLGTIRMILITSLLSAAILVLMLGALLMVLPAIILFVAAVIVVGLLRVYFQGAP
jgi:hypothetical protein